jgi:hypothetical protein
MRQMTLAHQAEFQRYSKKTRREQFLDEMDTVMPWAALVGLIEPHYPKGETGRKPVGLDIMLRVYFLQQWFALSDPGVEDALYESPVLRRFAGIDLGRAPVPDETTILNFRHLLVEHELCGQMLDTVNLYLEQGDPHHHRHDRGCDHHPRAFVHQEPGQGARSGDASDQERQSVVLRDEGAHRGGFQGGHRAFGLLDGGFRFRCAHDARLVAWRGKEGLG